MIEALALIGFALSAAELPSDLVLSPPACELAWLDPSELSQMLAAEPASAEMADLRLEGQDCGAASEAIHVMLRLRRDQELVERTVPLADVDLRARTRTLALAIAALAEDRLNSQGAVASTPTPSLPALSPAVASASPAVSRSHAAERSWPVPVVALGLIHLSIPELGGDDLVFLPVGRSPTPSGPGANPPLLGARLGGGLEMGVHQFRADLAFASTRRDTPSGAVALSTFEMGLAYAYRVDLQILGLGFGPTAAAGFGRVSGASQLPSVRGQSGYAPLASMGLRLQLTRELFSSLFLIVENDLSVHIAGVVASVGQTIVAQSARLSWTGALGLGVRL
ncbi:MAG: hypothetical protein IT384_06710 [Deltaproteobacteria bacterium]|nr:hypothetical protein [Deltaproteobacteria bacterium]